MYVIGKIDRNIYKCITDDIVTDEVIITDERIQHINKRHCNCFEAIEPYLKMVIENPDYILEDKNFNTGLILKLVEEHNLRFQIVLKIHTSADLSNLKNSIISAWEISERRWNNYIRNKKILYKRK